MWTAILFFVGLLILWVVFLRKWLKTKPWAASFFAWIEPFELAVYKKSESILWARVKQLCGWIGFALPLVGGFDPTSFLPFLPEAHRWWIGATPGLCLALDGMIGERLRNTVTKPIEVVSLPDKVSPAVAEAVAVADAAKVNAVAVIADEKAEKAAA